MAHTFTYFIFRSFKRRYATNLAKRVGDEGEVRRGVAEVLVEPGGERAEEEVIIDLRANVAELVSESLKAATIVVDGGVVLVAPKKLLLQKT